MTTNQSRISQINPKIEKIIQIKQPQVDTHVKNRIKQKLLQDAQFLFEKKKKQLQKKEKVKKLQMEIQNKRQSKLKAMQQKKNHSAIVIEKNRQMVNKKIKQQQESYNQIQDKIQKNQKQYVRKAMSRQKQLQKQLMNSRSKQLNNTHQNITSGSSFNLHRYSSYKPEIQQLSYEIQQKSKKAYLNHENFKQNIINKMRQKSQAISSIQQKALSMSMDGDAEKIKNWGKKIQNIEAAQQLAKTEREKTIIQRRKSIKNKLDRWSQNVRNITNKEQEKYQQLQNKFDRKLSPKQWKDEKLQKYWKLWQQNSQRITSINYDNASKILQKHSQISQQNRLYKLKKDKLLQQFKHI